MFYYLRERLQQLNVFTPSDQINKQARRIISKHPEVWNEVHEATNFLHATDDNLRVRLFCIKHDVDQQPTCRTCGRYVYFNHQKNRFNHYCANKDSACAAGDGDLQQKRINTIKERYNVDNPMKNKHIRQKMLDTLQVNYGVLTPIHSKEIQERRNQTITDRYGASNPSKNHNIKEKRKQTNIERYGSTTYAGGQICKEARALLESKEWLSDRLKDFTLAEISNELNVSTYLVRQYVTQHQLTDVIRHQMTTSGQREIIRILEINDIEYQLNNRTLIPPWEIDIFIPSMNIGIEFDGVFFHSELSGKDKKYHVNKTIACENAGIQLIHVWSSEWIKRNHIVWSRLYHAFNLNTESVYARKCQVKQITSEQSNHFMDQYHIQGKLRASIHYGLFHGSQLVAAMCFVRTRYKSKREDGWELGRYCIKSNINVVGGAGKLLSEFKRQYNPSYIVSYCDLRWGTGSLYKQLGFQYSHRTTPNYFYFVRNGDTNQLYSRISFQKHKLPNKLNHFDPQLTEWQNMVNNGYDRIWDCGNDVYVWNYDD